MRKRASFFFLQLASWNLKPFFSENGEPLTVDLTGFLAPASLTSALAIPQTLHSIPCSFRHARFSIPAGFPKTSHPVILNLFQNLDDALLLNVSDAYLIALEKKLFFLLLATCILKLETVLFGERRTIQRWTSHRVKILTRSIVRMT